MSTTELAQKYLGGEKLRQIGIDNDDKTSFSKGNRMIYEAVVSFQLSGESQELLFDEVERLDKSK